MSLGEYILAFNHDIKEWNMSINKAQNYTFYNFLISRWNG